MVRHLLAMFAFVGSIALCTAATAESVSSLARKLADSDFRVRTQAALALGASGSKKAIKPLCSALSDDSDTVRAASAAALSRLALGGKSCLKARKKAEKNKNVLKMIAKALRILDESGGGPQLGAASKHYIAMLRPKVVADRSKEVSAVVDATLRAAAARGRGLVVAPANESLNQAKKRLRKHPHVLGWALKPTVEVRYDGSQLVVRVDVDILGYPDKQSQGHLAQRAGMGGMDGKAPAKEDELVAKVTKDAFAKFVNMADQVN
jgi:HEAT repeats